MTRCGKLTARKITEQVPTTNAIAISHGTVRSPAIQAAGIVAMAAAEITSQAIMTGRCRPSRSAMAPAWSPISR